MYYSGEDPAASKETVVEPNPVWAMAAISKDGRRFAATKSARDTSIYVGDISGGPLRRFPLYNPDGIGVRTAVYAGSLDWDYSGENILYDVFHQIRGTAVSSMEYWDVDIMKVWDLTTNKYDESRFIRKAGLLTANSMAGYPCFDKRDEGMAYGSLRGADTVISWMPVKAGSTESMPAASPTLAARYQPAIRSISLEYSLPAPSWVRLSLYGMNGKRTTPAKSDEAHTGNYYFWSGSGGQA